MRKKTVLTYRSTQLNLASSNHTCLSRSGGRNLTVTTTSSQVAAVQQKEIGHWVHVTMEIFCGSAKTPCLRTALATRLFEEFEWQEFEIELQSKLYSLTEDEVESSNNTGLLILPEQHNSLTSAEGNKGELSTEHCVEDIKGDSMDTSIIEEDDSIICAFKNKVQTSEAQSGSESSAASGNTIVEECKCISAVPCVSSYGIMVGAPFTEHSSAFTQTEELLTADKNVLTELHMSDLDYVAQEFNKLKVAQEVRSKKEKSLYHRQEKQCDNLGCAQKAELSVLALQYHMCRQHICQHGNVSHKLSSESPASNTTVLQKLESDYNQMRDEILAGIPLDHLKPLTLDCEGNSDNVLGNPGSGVTCMEKAQQGRTLLECSQDAQRMSRSTSTTFKVNTPEENHSTGACKELNTGEVWYDAKEDIHPTSIPAMVEEQPEDMSKELANETKMAPGLGVPKITNNATEATTQKRLGFSSTPTARATFVPQHYGTTAAFDTLMTELTHIHPGVARQSFVGALKELWDIYQSDLWTLPLNIIRKMASDLLNRRVNVTPP
ncbi:RNA-binding protein 44 isoform X4 [Phyllopteryx taeniolatus]|uniref:RNA-binding protein 44 isoform X4 n=1 Tax=Phyllopteryx taeniolatus TaxID=161469 RepID=UPI002AD3AF09|nr:RNA-binding protein 44 isoform X4 [Phyllopteryx taeniolatus]